MNSSNPEKVVIWAISSLAFFGFFRLGELLPQSPSVFNPATDLAWGDVAIDDTANPTMVKVHLKKSKCDQFGSGIDAIVGRTGWDLCPVSALVQYINLRRDRAGPFFQTSSHEVVAKPWFVAKIRQILNAVGLPQQDYAGHSFRIGAATTAALADSTIQSLGRWHSTAFLQYIRPPREKLASVSSILAQSAHQHTQSHP